MQAVGTKDTGPEMLVRRILHAAGYRYRLHAKDLPGSPDIVMRSRKKAIFVHGCFWHGHGCAKGMAPKSRQEYWLPKIEKNRERDSMAAALLSAAGWDILTVWQCQLKDVDELQPRLLDFVDGIKKPIDSLR